MEGDVIMWVYMAYYHHEASGLYYVMRRRNNGALSTTPFGFKSADAAVNYIMAHGLTPHRINDR